MDRVFSMFFMLMILVTMLAFGPKLISESAQAVFVSLVDDTPGPSSSNEESLKEDEEQSDEEAEPVKVDEETGKKYFNE